MEESEEFKSFESIAELSDVAGLQLPASRWLAVDQQAVNEFASATGDFQWIHVDLERAASGPYGGPIAHGYLSLSLIGPLVASVLRVDGAASVINYGLEKVRFPSPLPVGSQVQLISSVVSSMKVAGGVQLTLHCALMRDDSSKPVCVAEPVYRYLA